MIGTVVTFGEIMLRLAPKGFLRFSQATNFDLVCSYGESNVAVSLANFGIDEDFAELEMNTMNVLDIIKSFRS